MSVLGPGWRSVLLAVVLVAAATLGTWSALVVAHHGRDTDLQLCESAREGRETFRQVLLFVRRATIAAARTADAKEAQVLFWDQVLALAPPIECEETGRPEPAETNGTGG